MNKAGYTSIDEAVEIPRFHSVSIGHSGKYVSYVKKTPDRTENAFRNHVWVYEAEVQRLYPITNGKNESNNPAWAPNNSFLAYTAEVGEKDKAHSQVFLKTFDEHNGIQITNSKEGINRFLWSPDGQGIFYTTDQADTEEQKKRKEVYGDFEYIDKEFKNSSLWYISIEDAIKQQETKKVDMKDESEEALKDKSKEASKSELKDIAIELTCPKEFHVRGFDISRDGKLAVLVCTPTSDIRDDNTSVYILNIENKKQTKLNISGMVSSSIAFSPDGEKLALTKSPRDIEYYRWKVEENFVLETYDIKTEKTLMKLEAFDYGVSVINWNSKGIFIEWQDRTSYRMGIASEAGKVTPLFDNEANFIMGASATQDGENYAYINTEKNKVNEVYLNGVQITKESKLYDDKLLSIKELVTWTTKDGLEIEGVLSKPQDYDASKKYPLLVVVHGGPTWASFPIHNFGLYPIEQFIEKGYVVLEPNYRGSSGYGNSFLGANYRMLGIGDYEDVISGVDMLIDKNIADKERVGVMGWSQGGYISAFCTTYSDRFKAVSVGAGISNWVTYYVNTDITTFTRSYLGATPWDDSEIYAKTSPMTYIKTACTPTLIQHGSNDNRVPVPNAYELYRGLKDLGIESELVIYKGMPHGPNKPGFQRAVMEQNLDWFTKHIEAK